MTSETIGGLDEVKKKGCNGSSSGESQWKEIYN